MDQDNNRTYQEILNDEQDRRERNIKNDAYADGMGDAQSEIFASIRKNPSEWRRFIDNVENGTIGPGPWDLIDMAHGKLPKGVIDTKCCCWSFDHPPCPVHPDSGDIK